MSSPSKFAALFGGLSPVILGSVVILTPPRALGMQEDPAARVEERLATLEKAVLRDPYKPQETILSRLDRVERELLERQRAAEKTDRSDQRTLAELQKALEKSQRQADDLARRVKSLESARTGDVVEPRDLNELRREVDGAKRRLDDLANRVRNLEARR